MFLKKINEGLAQAIDEAGYESPKFLQKKGMSKIKSGTDVICIGPEGSGKTTAIVMGIIQKLGAALNDVPRALVVVPEREHALDMKEYFDILGKNTNLRVHCVYNRTKMPELKNAIYLGADVVIGTAKRLHDLYSQSGLNLNDLKMFVIDDAEEIMKLEVMSQIDRLTDIIPDVQHILFATEYNDRIERYAEKYMDVMEIIEDKE